jgi:hypothetical protein
MYHIKLSNAITRTPLQKYLDDGRNPEQLKEELGINFYRHPVIKDLVGFKYSQLDSQKTNDVVRWSRGTVLIDKYWDLAAQSFVRFFNLGEGNQEEMDSFDWSDFRCWTKMDGSLIIMYHYNNNWLVNTSGSFGLGPINSEDTRSWSDVVWEVSKLNTSKMDPSVTYLFELCTPWNKIIRHYLDPKLVMLGAYQGPTDLGPDIVKWLAKDANSELVEEHSFKSKSDIDNFLSEKESKDATFEGVVIRDKNGLRYKVKSKTYLGLAHMYGNGQLGRPKRILPFVMAGDTGEILAYFPELKDEINNVERSVDSEYLKLLDVWREFSALEDQKEFALAIKPKTRFTSILFQLRKELGKDQTEEALRKKWKESGDLILKVMF